MLEIRGNPLPEGGFVTSYADITSYKNAARVNCVRWPMRWNSAWPTAPATWTRPPKRPSAPTAPNPLRGCRRARPAAAPNAARMFTSLLRSHLPDEAGRHAADSIEGALAAQDAILNSLLDIFARMESGQLEVHVRDVPLGPLLQVLGHNFGVLAENRGLQLRCVPTHAVVHRRKPAAPHPAELCLQRHPLQPRGRIVVGCRRTGDHLRIGGARPGPRHPRGAAARNL